MNIKPKRTPPMPPVMTPLQTFSPCKKHIKTIIESNTLRFDDKVNEAVECGWEITKRAAIPLETDIGAKIFFYAELERGEFKNDNRESD